MIATAEAIFWFAAAMLAYVYAGFPLLLALRAATRPRPIRRADITPRLSLVVAAYNEARGIAAKIDNMLELDYPPESIELIVASDGSDDDTDSIVSRYVSRGVQLLSLPRRGKLHALDAAVARATGDLVVFSDANTLFDRQALRMLARSFADPAVGGVCGDQRHAPALERDSSGRGERLYWSYDKALKALECRSGSIVAADGAIYAIRRELYRKPESPAMTDDFAISTAVVLQGRRLVWEPGAVAWETTAGEARHEFERKVRIMTRGWHGVLQRRALLDPRRYGFYSVVLFSHKVLRRVTPVFALALLGASLVTAGTGSVYLGAAVGQLAFYALAAIGGVLRAQSAGRSKLLFAPFFFVLANAAALVALIRLARGRRVEHWQPRRALPEPPAAQR